MGFIWFFLGMLLGGAIGIVAMCLFQINKYKHYEEQIRQIEEQINAKK